MAVWDIETQNRIDEMPGRYREDKIKLLPISCASIVKIPSELCLDPADRERAMELSSTTTYWVDGEGPRSMAAMCDVLLGAELVVGFNLAGFDYLSAKKYFKNPDDYHRCCEQTLDVFSRIRDATGVWYKLDRLLSLNGLATKTADGLQVKRNCLQLSTPHTKRNFVTPLHRRSRGGQMSSASSYKSIARSTRSSARASRCSRSSSLGPAANSPTTTLASRARSRRCAHPQTFETLIDCRLRHAREYFRRRRRPRGSHSPFPIILTYATSYMTRSV